MLNLGIVTFGDCQPGGHSVLDLFFLNRFTVLRWIKRLFVNTCYISVTIPKLFHSPTVLTKVCLSMLP